MKNSLTPLSEMDAFFNQPVFILAEPQMGENIGAVARAMLNCGLTELRIVNPRDGWPNEKAEAMSAGALSRLRVDIFPTLSEAVADCHRVYATAADSRDMVKPVLDAHQAASKMKDDLDNAERVAVIFGRERSGLTNDEIALAHYHVAIPLNTDFNSLNLGQAALIVAYEYRRAAMIEEKNLPRERPATAGDFDRMCLRLEDEIDRRGFFKSSEMKTVTMRNIRNFLVRGGPTDQEIRTFQGIITALTGSVRR